jgi:hypothetical protein
MVSRKPNLLAALILGALGGCGSNARKPTLPAPEFEVPEVPSWDAGGPRVSGASEPNLGAATRAAPPGDANDPVPDPAALPAEAAPAADEPSTSSLPVAEPPTSTNIEPKP